MPVVLERAAVQFRALAAELARQPETAAVWRPNPDGTVKYGTLEGWTSGFFPGTLWYLYELTGEGEWRDWGRRFSDRQKKIRHFNGHHDIGFMLMCSVGNGLRLAKGANDAAILKDGADALMTRYKPDLKTIQSWPTGSWCDCTTHCPVIIDNMMNLELLEWAYKTTGEKKYDEAARAHADTADRNHFRPDGTAYHIVDYNPKNGKVLAYYAGQGASADGAWSRGQAWATYGFTMMYRETREPRYLARACRSADAFLAEPSTPEDGIPYWDFRAAEIPNAPRDASSAAIAASAMLELSTFAQDGGRYRAAAVKMLNALASDAYLSPAGANAGFLLMHSTGNAPGGSEVDSPLTYADYYFLEALKRFRDLTVKKDAFFFLHATDLHMTENPDIERGALQMKDKFMGPCFIDAVNARAKADPGVAFIALTGDLTSGVDMDPSCWPFAERKWRHYRKYVTDRLRVPWHQIIGNNDCAEVPYRKVFSECPIRWTFDRGGVRFVGLNGYDLWTEDCTNHAGILYGKEQLEWLDGLVSDCESETLVLFTHEPLQDPDSHRARKQLAPILAKFRGAFIWNICGHNHWNSDAIVRVGSRDVRVVQTMTPVGEWRIGDGVYRSFAVERGRIVSSDLHWLTKDGEPIRVEKSPDWDSPGRVEMIEETLPRGSLAFGLVGESGLQALPGGCYQDRLSDYYLRPHGGIVSWTVNPKGASRIRFAIAGRLEGALRLGNAEGMEVSVPVSLSPENPIVALPGRVRDSTFAVLTLCNESKYEFKLFGYALF